MEKVNVKYPFVGLENTKREHIFETFEFLKAQSEKLKRFNKMLYNPEIGYEITEKGKLFGFIKYCCAKDELKKSKQNILEKMTDEGKVQNTIIAYTCMGEHGGKACYCSLKQIGIITYTTEANKGYISLINVDSKARNNGVGKSLTQMALNDMKSKSCDNVIAEVTSDGYQLLTQVGFEERKDFKEDGLGEPMFSAERYQPMKIKKSKIKETKLLQCPLDIFKKSETEKNLQDNDINFGKR